VLKDTSSREKTKNKNNIQDNSFKTIDNFVSNSDNNHLKKNIRTKQKPNENEREINYWNGETNYEKKIIQANLTELIKLEEEAVNFIREVCKKYPQANYEWLISFSGGKDSTIVAFLVNQALKQQKITLPLLFSNTTIEFPETIQFSKDFSEKFGNQLIEVKGERDFLENCENLGPPSRMMRWCCSTQKSMPINTFQRTIKKPILSFDGIRKDESNLRKGYPRIKKNTKVTKQLSIYPILEWSDLHVWLYILWRQIPFNKAYRYGYSRVGCWACPNNTKFDWILSAHFVPDFQKWQDYLKEYGKKLGKDEAWITDGQWKARRVHYNYETKIKKNHPCLQGNDIFYTLDKQIPNIGEFLKIFGPIDKDFDVMGKKQIVGKYCKILFSPAEKAVRVQFDERKQPPHYKYQVEKQIIKATNCINCGACVGVCPNNAISFNPTLQINSEKCTGCMICTTNKFLGASCVALHYKTDQMKIENSFKYHHAVPGDIFKNAFHFSTQLYKKLMELNLVHIDDFLEKDIEYLIQKTGLSKKLLEKNQKIAQAYKTAKILPFNGEATKKLNDIWSKKIIFTGFKFSEDGETITSVNYLDCKVDNNRLQTISPDEFKIKEDLQSPNSVFIYFETNQKKNKYIRDFFKELEFVKKDSVVDFYRFIVKYFAIPIQKKGNERLQKIITLVNETNDDDYYTLEKPFQLHFIFDHLKNLSFA
jgi:phosphoadenosine phosphosulfate reductase